MNENGLNRFIEAQNKDYQQALLEIRNGKKCSCWIWYIFPQIAGLGFSYMCQIYDIQSLQEAKDYLENPILREHLLEISNALLDLNTNNPIEIFGEIDSLKVKSSMTLFEVANPNYEIFSKVLDKFYNGERDIFTLEILESLNG